MSAMIKLKKLLHEPEWKLEDHTPVIAAPDTVKKGEVFKIKASIGEETPHPHKKEHHIGWITLLFRPEGEKYPYVIGKADFSWDAESRQYSEEDVVCINHDVTVSFRTDKSGTIFATSLCTLHGLWQASKNLQVI